MWNWAISFLVAGLARCASVGQSGNSSVPRVSAYKDLHLFVQAVVHDEGVGHADPVGLHGMPWAVVVVANVRVEKVALPSERRQLPVSRRAASGLTMRFFASPAMGVMLLAMLGQVVPSIASSSRLGPRVDPARSSRRDSSGSASWPRALHRTSV